MDEDKVQQLVDRQEIIDRMHWYTSWVDLNRVDKQVEVFAEDGRLTFYGDDHWIEGKDNIQEALLPSVAKYAATHHYISNIVVTFDSAKTANAISYVQAWHRPADGSDDYTLHAQYHDKWVKIFGAWKLSERRLKTAGTSNRSDGPNLEPIDRV